MKRRNQIAELGPFELEKFWRNGSTRPALEKSESRQQLGGRRLAEIDIHLHCNGVARSGGCKVGRKKKTKHIAGPDVSGNKAKPKQL